MCVDFLRNVSHYNLTARTVCCTWTCVSVQCLKAVSVQCLKAVSVQCLNAGSVQCLKAFFP